MENIRYQYDPLDRIAMYALGDQSGIQRFYLKDRLISELEGAVHRSIFQYEEQLLAQQGFHNGAGSTTLLVTDQKRSVLNALIYTPYGYVGLEELRQSVLGFNGERPDPATGAYLLGNGYRAFNTVLMRFNSPDSMSPFGKGGLNSYCYCFGDPINWGDATGHMPKGLKALFGIKTKVSQSNSGGLARSPVTTPAPLKASAQQPPELGVQGSSGSGTRMVDSRDVMSRGASPRPVTATQTVAPPPQIRVQTGGKIVMVNVTPEQMRDIRVAALENPNLTVEQQSISVQRLVKLPRLEEGSNYMFPNMPSQKSKVIRRGSIESSSSYGHGRNKNNS